MLLKNTPDLHIKLKKPKASPALDVYWEFATKRQDAFFARVRGESGPWSQDSILNTYKFTNAYRASDRVSQYLIKNVIYSKEWSLKDTVFRILLFKFFNKIETWEFLEKKVGEIKYTPSNIKLFDNLLENEKSKGTSIYSAAYIMPSGPRNPEQRTRKHTFHLQLLDRLMKTKFHEELYEIKSMKEGFESLLNIEFIGNFLAYQFITDLNYSPWFNYSESEFVVPGPGAIDGIKKCFIDPGDYTKSDIIKYVYDKQQTNLDRLGLDFKSLWGRELKLIDCQNLFCETDKYLRVSHPNIQGVSGRKNIKQKFHPKSNSATAWYPPKWELNDKINQELTL